MFPKDCGSTAPSLDNGDVVFGSETTFGSTATINCDEDFVSVNPTITCQANGEWETPSCIAGKYFIDDAYI